MSKFITQTRVTDTLNGTMAAGATSCTLLSGNFGAPTGKQIITIDHNVAAKAADFLCTINNTAVTNMVKLNGPDVEHTTNAAVCMSAVDEHFNLIFNALDDGWVDPNETWTYASATTFTISGDRTGTIAVGDKIKLTQTTVKYFYVTDVSYSAPNTTVTITGGSDYTLANAAITSPYCSKASSPVGFPQWFAYTPTISVSDGTPPTYTGAFVSRFRIAGRSVLVRLNWENTSGGTAGAGGNAIEFTLPVVNNAYNGTYRTIVGTGKYLKTGATGTIFVNDGANSNQMYFRKEDNSGMTGGDQDQTARYIKCNFEYEI